MHPSLRQTLLSTCIVAFILSLGTAASAQNPDKFYLSGDAALQGGAITADASGGGAIWYNPAGLAKMRGLRFDVSMNAYSLRFGGNPELGSSDDNAEVTRLTALEFNVAPAGLTVTKRLGELGVGFGVFVPELETTNLRTRVVQPSQGGYPGVDFAFDVHHSSKEYLVGPSAGLSLGKRVDIGLSLLFNYRTSLSILGVDAAVDIPGTDPYVFLTHQLLDWQQIGIQPVLGVQVRLAQHWSLGATVRFPGVRIYELLQSIEVQNAADDTGRVHQSEFTDESGFSDNVVRPARFHVGLSHDFDEDTRVAIEWNYQAPIRNAETGEDFRPLMNFRVGGRHQVRDNLSVGGGLFSNRSAARGAVTFGDSQLDFYGVTLAADFGTRYGIFSRGGETLDPAGSLFFGTTAALSYALGVGPVVRADVGYDPVDETLYREATSDVVAHEIVFSLGSTLSE